MAEFLHPDVFTEERGLPPTIVGVSTSTAGFVGTSRKGPIDKLSLVDGFRTFERVYGTNFADSFLEDAVFQFFENGGNRCQVGRAVGTGSAVSTINAPALAGAPSAAQINSGAAAPYNLEPGDLIDISVDGGGAQSFVFTAARGVHVAAGAAAPPATGGETLVVSFDGGGLQTVTFTAGATSADLLAGEINSQVVGGRAVNVAGTLQLESDTRGSGSAAAVDASSSGPALTITGFAAGSTAGTGVVVNIDAVLIAEVISLLSTLTDATATANGNFIRITHDTAGVSSTLEVTAAAAVFSFPGGEVPGAATTLVDMLQLDARTVGAHGDGITFTTQRWSALTTEVLNDAGTQVALASVASTEIGDIVLIDDGTTSVIVHVNGLDVANKRIQFQAVTLGSPIAIGATAKTASSHRAKTTLSEAALSTDTSIKVSSTAQLRIGTELSIDDGTSLLFRVVTAVNGSELTLNAALGAAIAAGTTVVSQHFNLTINVDNIPGPTFTFLSTQDTDTRDWVELRLFGDANESSDIEVVDLNPAIGTAIQDRPAAVVNQALAGGQDGAVPGDNDFIGTSSPPTGLQLFENTVAGEINILAIPGISSVLVQQALADFATRKENLIALIDPPLSLEEPVEIRDWRLNVHNRDTSYAALYYPWLEVRDRHSAVSGATKSIPPSGSVAGLYSRVDGDEGVWVAPGNKGLLSVIRPIVKISDGQQDTLNPIGVNVIRTFPGEGTRVWGIRTLSNVADGRQYVHIRRLLNFCKVSIAIALRRFIFDGIQPSLFRTISNAITSFYRTIWLAGGLFPNNSFPLSQFVKVDVENNPADTRKLGQLFVDTGINPPFPAEFIILRIGLFDGETTVDEV